MQITLDRRALHRIPELDRDLPKTMEYLRSSLSSLKCKVFSPIPSALCAWFDFGAEEAIAFRADADALPITERSSKDYASQHPGRMHACGHDGHMAILLELARRLDKKESLRYNVLLVFQPAEETTGGAKDICKTGIFKKYKVDAIFALHLWPGLEAGIIASRRNEVSERVPRWQGGRYDITLVKTGGLWKIIGMQQKTVLVEPEESDDGLETEVLVQ